jgi:dTDP-4-amino-4,6-dideoxygalactose transaminase
MAAELGRYQLGHLDERVRRRCDLARTYDEAFDGHARCRVFRPVGRAAHYKYQLLLDRGVDRARLVRNLGERGVQCGAVYDPPIHLQPVYRRKFGFAPGAFPNAEDVARRVVALPLFVELTDAQQRTVIDAVLEAVA